MKRQYYVKLVDDFINSPKVKRLEKRSDGHSLMLLLIHLLSDVKNTEGVLLVDMVDERLPMDAETIHEDHPSFSVKFISAALEKFVEMDLLQVNEDGFLQFSNYYELTNTKDAAKMQRYRRRKRAEAEGSE